MQAKSNTSLLLALLGTILSLIIAEIPLDLRSKIALSLLFVFCSYAFIFKGIKQTNDYLSIFTVLLILSIPFYYGQHIIALISPEYLLMEKDYSVIDGKIPDRHIVYATFLAINSLLVLYAGYVRVPQNKLMFNDWEYNADMKALKIAGWMFFIISLLPAFRLLLAQYQLTVANGYLGRRMMETESDYIQVLGVSYVEIYVAQIFIPSVYALIVAYKGKKMNKLLFGILAIYCMLYVLTGSRFTILKILVSVALIYYTWIKEPTKKDVRKLAIAGICAALFFTVGSIIRSVGVSEFSGDDISSNFEIYDTFWESGITFTSISNILRWCPSHVDFFYGKSIIGAILQCIPGASGMSFFSENNLHISATFSPLLYGANTLTGYGSSFIAEGYYNFGYLMYIYIYILGGVYAKVKNAMVSAQNTGNPFTLLFFAYLCGELAYAVRNDLCNIPRTVLYSVGIIIVVAWIISPKKNN